jgi:hypothetical protein
MDSPGNNDSARNGADDSGTVVKQLPPLHWGVRLMVLVIGALLVVVGIAGLVLPGIQGVLTIMLGLAVMSLASEFVHRQLRRLLARWPTAGQKMERFRERIHSWLSK